MLKRKLKPSFGKNSIIFTVVAALLVAADLVTKYLEERFVWRAVIIPNVAEIKSGARNPGCAFSILNENPEMGQPILITVTFLMLAFLIFAFIFVPDRFILLKLSISIVVAGAVGNLVDRLMLQCVRDWFGLWMINMVYCNLADFWIVIGTFIAVIDLLFLNEWAVFPLTKKAKAAQAARKEEEERERAEKEDKEKRLDGNDTSADGDK